MIGIVYEAALRVVRAALQIAVRGDGKIARGVAGRRHAVAQLEAWVAEQRTDDVPLVWMHAPSAGEVLMADAIIRALRERVPACQIALTFFSPAAERVAARTAADVVTYLPWDTEMEVRRALDALRPRVVAFIRTEVWPTLVREARRQGARVALLNAPLGPHSSRLRPIARRALRAAYASLDAVGAVGEADARRFALLGVPAARVSVTGDARFDQVMARIRRTAPHARIPAALRDVTRPVVVAGSIWKADIRRLLPAMARLRERTPLVWVLVPHEPSPVHVGGLERALDRQGIRHARIDGVDGSGDFPEAVIVDRVGMLADLYAIARVAYVGGGFGRAGLHAVIEPAALGVPVLFGPRHGNTVEADDLAAVGGGWVVRNGIELAAMTEALLHEDEAGRAARAFVTSRQGGSEANAALIERLLGPP